jgi:pimeloyl-ACP methyl ester carboxylesterase
MFDPRSIWIGMALIAALFLAYTSFKNSSSRDAQRSAYLRERVGSEIDVKKISRDECLGMGQRLWAETKDEVECIAYVKPADQPSGSKAMVFFHGDFASGNQTTSRMTSSRQGYQFRANGIARYYKIPVFVMARPGVMGSTGFHVIGGVRSEHGIMAAALAELKQRYGLDRLVLGGQSGGARLAAQMLASGRDDIDCAVMASGAYDLPRLKGGGRTATNLWGEPSRSFLIPLRSIESVVANRERRLFVLGDPRDQRTPFDEQQRWADMLRQAGHHVVLLQGAGQGKEFHGLSGAGMRVAGMCAVGISDQEISRYIESVWARSVRTSQ